MFLKQHVLEFVTYEIPQGKYSIEDISEFVYTKADHAVGLQLEYDDFNMKTKLILKGFGEPFEFLRIIEKNFSYIIMFHTIFGMINIVLTSMVVTQVYTLVKKF